MTTQTIQLLDRAGRIIATATTAENNDGFAGTVDLSRTPRDLRALFEEFEEVVQEQMLSLVDDVTDRIDALQLIARFDDHSEADVRDLQVFPETGAVSFGVEPRRAPTAGFRQAQA